MQQRYVYRTNVCNLLIIVQYKDGALTSMETADLPAVPKRYSGLALELPAPPHHKPRGHWPLGPALLVPPRAKLFEGDALRVASELQDHGNLVAGSFGRMIRSGSHHFAGAGVLGFLRILDSDSRLKPIGDNRLHTPPRGVSCFQKRCWLSSGRSHRSSQWYCPVRRCWNFLNLKELLGQHLGLIWCLLARLEDRSTRSCSPSSGSPDAGGGKPRCRAHCPSLATRAKDAKSDEACIVGLARRVCKTLVIIL